MEYIGGCKFSFSIKYFNNIKRKLDMMYNEKTMMGTGVNPTVSWTRYTKGIYTKNGDRLDVVNLYTILKLCESGLFRDLEKGERCMLPYTSSIMGVKPYSFDGVVFVDLDKFTQTPELRGKQNEIFNSFDKISSECLYNLLAMKYSPSGNLHAFFYHPLIKDEKQYDEFAMMDLALLACAIKKILGIDLRDFDGVLDTHQKHYQKLNLNHSEFKWNIWCTPVSFKKGEIEKLKNEYPMCFKGISERRVSGVCSTKITGKGDVCIDRDYCILGWTGYDARTVVAAAAYIHFHKDMDKTREWLSKTFSNANEINSQLESMVRNNRIESKYHPQVEDYLFDKTSGNFTEDTNNIIQLEKNQFLSDMIDIRQLTDKYYYIVSNTGTGKTEFVKSLFNNCYVKKLALVQMNKALRDGKKYGIEAYTMDNSFWDKSFSKDKVHTTTEGFVRNMKSVDLSEYVVVIDEAHLLQDYTSMNEKLIMHRSLLSLIENAGILIFMSATPKSEMKLYPFNVMKFVKIQPTLLEIQLHPLKYGKGRGSKENARYSYMNQLIAEQANKTKCLVFSNKFYTKWQDYGMNKLDYRLFHSRNKGEEWVECILNENRPETNITLATNYLGIGVEIKNEEEVHIYFDLNEGWDMDFIIQSLGRPRDAKTIVLHLFYTEKDAGIRPNLDDEDLKTILSTAFRNLVTENRESGEPIINLLAARMTNVYDGLYNQRENNDKIEPLIISRILNGYCNMSIWDLDLLVKRLKFESIKVHENNVQELLSTGKRIKVEETALCDMLCSRTDEWWERNLNRANESILVDPDLIFNDKVRAGKLLTMCRKIWWNGFNLHDTREYFGSVTTAEKVIGYLNKYCQVMSGQASMECFEGSEISKEEIEKEFSVVETVFNKEYLDYRIDMECARIPMRDIPVIPYDFNDIFKEVWDSSVCNDIIENNVVPSPFVGRRYKERLSEKKTEMSLINGKIGGKKSSPRKNISIQKVSTGEVMEFPSKTDCMNFLKISSATFSKFIKEGVTKKTLDWVPVQVGGETVRYAS